MPHDPLERASQEMRLRNYSPKTIKAYLGCLKEYLSVNHAASNSCDVEALRRFLLDKQAKGLSPQTINLCLNAIKFYYHEVAHWHGRIDLKFAKRFKRLPVVLSKSEVLRLLGAIQNLKHKTMIALAYGAGLRVSEVYYLVTRNLQLVTLNVPQDHVPCGFKGVYG